MEWCLSCNVCTINIRLKTIAFTYFKNKYKLKIHSTNTLNCNCNCIAQNVYHMLVLNKPNSMLYFCSFLQFTYLKH